MGTLTTLAGVAVLIVVVTDVVQTTLSAARGGMLTEPLGKIVWEVSRHSSAAGPLVLTATALLWVSLLWSGWALVFSGVPEAVLSASTREPAGGWERIYFAGYTVATLGMGDFVPGAPVWRVATVAASFSGLLLLTLGVTYYTAILKAAVDQQQIAAQITSLGGSPAEIVARAWDGSGFAGVDTILAQLSAGFTLHARRHYAYPALHFYRTREPSAALPVQMAKLADALTLWQHVVAADHRPPPVSLKPTVSSIDAVLAAARRTGTALSSSPPPPPDLAPLNAANIPLVEAPERAFEAPAVVTRRRALLGLVESQHYAWSDVST